MSNGLNTQKNDLIYNTVCGLVFVASVVVGILVIHGGPKPYYGIYTPNTIGFTIMFFVGIFAILLPVGRYVNRR